MLETMFNTYYLWECNTSHLCASFEANFFHWYIFLFLLEWPNSSTRGFIFWSRKHRPSPPAGWCFGGRCNYSKCGVHGFPKVLLGILFELKEYFSVKVALSDFLFVDFVTNGTRSEENVSLLWRQKLYSANQISIFSIFFLYYQVFLEYNKCESILKI